MSTALHLIVWLGALVPRVDDPWPSHVGVSLPFTTAGVGSVVGGMLNPDAPPAARDRRANWFSFWGFWAGALFYILAFILRLTSSR